MSLIDLASLVLAPTAVKDGKVYNAIPNDQDFTFSRGTEATRVNSAGLIEKARTNLLYYSQDFSNSNWVLQNNATITHNITDPNGGTTASRLTFDSLTNSGLYQQQLTNFGTGLIRTASIYLKGAVGGENVMIGDASNRTRVVLTTDWVRYEGFASDDSTFFIIYTDHISGASSDTIDIAFAQYENGLVSTDYIETTTSSVTVGITDDLPRVDYSGGGCPSLLLEPSRTNLVTQSEYFGDSSWSTYSFGGASLTKTFGYTSPEGINNAYKFDVVVGTGGILFTHNFTATASVDHTLSVWMKGEIGGEKVQIDFKNAASSGITGSLLTLTNQWKRYDLTFTNDTGTSRGFQLRMQQPSGVSDQTIYIYGAQAEGSASYVSSYIPTYKTSTSRSADSCSLTNASNLIGQSEGTLFAEFIMPPSGTLFSHYRLSGVGGLYNDSQNITLTDTNTIRGWSFSGTAVQANIESGVYAEGTKVKVAYAYKANDFILYINGTQIGTDTSGSVPSMSEILIGSYYPNTSLNVVNKTKQAILFPTRLTNDQLQELTK